MTIHRRTTASCTRAVMTATRQRLIGAMRTLSKIEHRPNPITFIFQPAEEGGRGGERMVEDGAMRGVIFGDSPTAVSPDRGSIVSTGCMAGRSFPLGTSQRAPGDASCSGRHVRGRDDRTRWSRRTAGEKRAIQSWRRPTPSRRCSPSSRATSTRWIRPWFLSRRSIPEPPRT